jgi:hypothetical protein
MKPLATRIVTLRVMGLQVLQRDEMSATSGVAVNETANHALLTAETGSSLLGRRRLLDGGIA